MLSLESFDKGMKLLASRFGKKPNKDLLEIYYSRVKKIPDQAFDDIVISMIDGSKYFPRPGEINGAWYVWLIEHPENVKKRQCFACAYCNTTGCLDYRIPDQPNETIDMCRCGHCENWREVGISDRYPLWTVEDILSRGFEWWVASVEVDDENPWPLKNPKPIRSVNEEVERIADKAPF